MEDPSGGKREDDDRIGDRLRELGKQPLRIPNRRKQQRSSDESKLSSSTAFSARSWTSNESPQKDSPIFPPDSIDTLIGYTQPSPQEAMQYFRGLLGPSKLLARTSMNPWTQEYRDSYPRSKVVTNVGNHRLVNAYNTQIRKDVWKALRHIPWVTIDISRIGFSGKQSEDPIVMLITVNPGSTTWRAAQDVVVDCQKLISDKAGHKIEVEMREGATLVNFAGNEVAPPESVEEPYQRIPRIGQSIGLQDDSNEVMGAGTLAAYVKIVGGRFDGETCAMAVHHVTFPRHSPSPAGKGQIYWYTGGQRQILVQPATLDHQLLSEDIKSHRTDDEEELRDFMMQDQLANQNMAKPLTAYQRQEIANLQAKIQSYAARQLQNDLFSRKFGYVIVSSGISRSKEHGNIRDWSLIRLDSARFNKVPVNMIPDIKFPTPVDRSLNRGLKTEDRFKPGIKTSPITKIVSLDEVLRSPVLDTSDERSFRVLKYGRSTHWTAGVVNEIRSDCQREEGNISTELCVLNLTPGFEFTKPGDSGALVIDYRGRAVGVAHGGGATLSHGSDFHYVTPIEWLLEDIKEKISANSIVFSS